jgi:aminomethyltransferase
LVGRVTSARYSPILAKSIGLGWVNSDYFTIGIKLTLRSNGSLGQATIVEVPFYDPDGIKLKG